MAKKSLFLVLAVAISAALWSGSAFAVYQETSVTVTDKGTPVPGQTVTLTMKQQDPQRPKKKPRIKHVVKRKTNRDGKVVVAYDDQDRRSDIFFDITLRSADGRSRTIRDVAIATLIAGGGLDFTNVPFDSETTSQAPAGQIVQPVSYIPTGWVFVLGGNVGGGQSRNNYEDFPAFDGNGWGGGGFVGLRYYTPAGWFVGIEGGGMSLRINGTNPDDAFSNIQWMAFEGGQVGYSFRTPGATPVNVYVGAGASQAGYNVGIDTRALSESMDKTLAGWTAHAGIEVQPAPTVLPGIWVGLDYRYAHFSGNIGGDPVGGQLNFFSATASYQFPAGR